LIAPKQTDRDLSLEKVMKKPGLIELKDESESRGKSLSYWEAKKSSTSIFNWENGKKPSSGFAPHRQRCLFRWTIIVFEQKKGDFFIAGQV